MSLLKAIAGTFGTYPGSTGCLVIHRNRPTICAMRSSENGINWHRSGTVAVDFEHKNEIAIARPVSAKISISGACGIATEEVISLIEFG